MSALSIQPTYPIFTDIDGQPLEDGYVWIGTANLDPQTSPINVYWDAALTLPAAQPIRTLAGYPANSGTPARLYVNSDYSIRVMNKNGGAVYSAPAATERYSGVVVGQLSAENVSFSQQESYSQGTAGLALQSIVSVKDAPFNAAGDGSTNDTAAIQAAVTAQAGKSLYFPDGNYVNDSVPAGINDLVIVGTPRVNFTGKKIPLFSGVYSGDLEIAIVAGVIRYYDATTTPLGNGYINGETVQIVQSGGSGGTATVTTSGVDNGVNTVTLDAVGSGYVNGNALLTSSTGSGCQVTLTTSAGAITGVTKKSGWYFLKDGQERHDPILMGPVTASGTGSLNLQVNFGQLGLNPAEWTPSGFVCGPDETLADSGVTFGASVSPTNVTIQGTYNTQQAGYVSYNGSAWVFSGIGYDSPTFSGGILTLTRPTNSTKAAGNYTPSVVPVMRRQTAADWGANIVNVDLYAITSTTISLIFTDASGNPIATPDTRFKFWLTDSLIRNPDFNFGADPGGGTNIWMVGAFTRRKDLY